MNRKLKIILVVLVVAVAAAMFYSYMETNNKWPKRAVKPLELDKKELAAVQIPAGFPENFPVEAGSEVLQNFEVSTQDGRLQSTRVVTTKLSTTEAIDFYAKAFTVLGWTNVTTGEQRAEEAKAVLRKDDDLVQMRAKGNTVEIVLTQITYRD